MATKDRADSTSAALTYGVDMWDQVDELKKRAQHNRTNLGAWRQFMTSFHSAYASFGQHLQEITDTLKETLEPKASKKDTPLEELHTI